MCSEYFQEGEEEDSVAGCVQIYRYLAKGESVKPQSGQVLGGRETKELIHRYPL